MRIGKVSERIAEPFKLAWSITDDDPVVAGTNGQFVAPVGPNCECPFFGVKLQLEIAVLKRYAEMITKKGHEKFIVQILMTGTPVDVEPGGVFGLRTPFQDVQPPPIIRATDPHMVRDEIEYLAQAICLEGIDHGFKISIGAQLWIKLDVTDDIISVRTPRPRLQVGRRVDVAHAELGKVRRDQGGRLEAEVLRELQPVGCPGDCSLTLFCQWCLRLADARIEWLRSASARARSQASLPT